VVRRPSIPTPTIRSSSICRTEIAAKGGAVRGVAPGTGYVSFLPVDQGIERSAGASFAPNPVHFDSENIVKLAPCSGQSTFRNNMSFLFNQRDPDWQRGFWSVFADSDRPTPALVVLRTGPVDQQERGHERVVWRSDQARSDVVLLDVPGSGGFPATKTSARAMATSS